MLIEFVNALFTLNTKHEYPLYEGKTEKGFTKVTITVNSASGYNMQYFKIKQLIIEEGKQAKIQEVDVPNLETVYKIVEMAIREKETKNGVHEHGTASLENISRLSRLSGGDQSDNNDSPIPVVQAKSKPHAKPISSEPVVEYSNSQRTLAKQAERTSESTISNAFEGSEYPGGIDSGLESFMGGGLKIANMPSVSNRSGQASAEHRNSMESILGGDLF